MIKENDNEHREAGGGAAVADDAASTIPPPPRTKPRRVKLLALADVREEFMFPTFLNAEMKARKVKRADLARAAGVFPSYIDAVLDGSLIPTSRVLDSMAKSFYITIPNRGPYIGAALYDARLFQNHSTDKELYAMEVLAATTTETTLSSLFVSLLNGKDTPFRAPEICDDQKINYEYFMSIKNGSNKKKKTKAVQEKEPEKGQKRSYRTSYHQETLDKFCTGFSIPADTKLRNLFYDIAHGRASEKTFGQILLEATEEGLVFSKFLERLMDEWKVNQYELADHLGYRQPVISKWLGEDDGTSHGPSVPETLSKRFQLNQNRFEDHAIWRITRGDPTLKSIESIVEKEKGILGGNDEEKKEGVSAHALKQFMAYTGFTPDKICETVKSAKPATIRGVWLHKKVLHLSPVSIEELADTFVIDTPKKGEPLPDIAKRRSLKLGLKEVLSGEIGKYVVIKTPNTLLDEAISGIEVALRFNPGAAKERFSTLISGVLVHRDQTDAEFGAEIDFKYPGEPRHGLSKKTLFGWRNGVHLIESTEVAEATADLIGYKDKRKENFVLLSTGKWPFYDPKVLEEAMKGKISRSDTLRRLRRNQGLTQIEFADEINSTEGTVERWDQEGLIDTNKADEAATKYGIPVEDRQKFVAHFARTHGNKLDEQTRRAEAAKGKGDRGG